MKTIILSLTLLALNATVSFAQAVDFTHLKAESFSALESFPFDESCQFAVQEVEAGLELFIQEDKVTTVKILVNDADKITVDARTDADGSYIHKYKVAGVGALTIIHMDDAHNSIELSDGKYAARCVVEF